jgi:hypothetical protein
VSCDPLPNRCCRCPRSLPADEVAKDQLQLVARWGHFHWPVLCFTDLSVLKFTRHHTPQLPPPCQPAAGAQNVQPSWGCARSPPHKLHTHTQQPNGGPLSRPTPSTQAADRPQPLPSPAAGWWLWAATGSSWTGPCRSPVSGAQQSLCAPMLAQGSNSSPSHDSCWGGAETPAQLGWL